ncbi:flagellar biosynthesis protein FliQ [Telmatospirillum siberiense]|uniref:Flagellar biosynthetic protein FliQ n=1 Tax=Telmatospirillum siberiense TaxID=382514 RepID=A0A2N3Q048_9PROT|nr:flagellar biosynthesis protein FliQ [Telmatospirillum siberiense]PKU26025.1 flagellar biosynthetic protein FliQ [Telmatospirillum siberiense]
MTEGELIEIANSSMLVMMKVAAPPLFAGLVIGLAVSLFQALTQIQEATLTFVPKVLAVFVALLIFLPFILHTLMDFMHLVLDRAISGG